MDVNIIFACFPGLFSHSPNHVSFSFVVALRGPDRAINPVSIEDMRQLSLRFRL